MIGSKLRELLQEKNLSPADLSRLTGVSYQTIISIIKRDNMKVDLAQLAKISDALGVSIEVFYMEYDSYMKRESAKIGLTLSDTDPQINAILSNAQKLNAQGLAKLEEYSDDLVSSGKYERAVYKEGAG